MVLGLALLILVAALAYYFSTGIHDMLVKLLITLLVVTCVLMAALAINGKSRSWIAIQSKKSLFRHSVIVILPLAAFSVIIVILGFLLTWSYRASRPIMFEAALAVLGGAGAAIALVVNYRRQKVLESETLTKRFSDFTNQLADDKPPVKLAGVYSLLRLADEWKEQRQQIVDVLCSYLRLPWPDDKEELASKVEQEVRRTILREMVSRMKEGESFTEIPLDYDFSGTTFKGLTNFSGAMFTGCANFASTTFEDPVVFSNACFERAAFFNGSRFLHSSAGLVLQEDVFKAADFSRVTFNEIANFNRVTIEGPANFNDATFKGAAYFATHYEADSDFSRAVFEGLADFMMAVFEVNVTFEHCTWNSDVRFSIPGFKARCILSDVNVWPVDIPNPPPGNITVTLRQ